jgi:quercetin dioxygenase-like cupin family protein
MLRKESNASFDDPSFEYLPGETVVIPSNVEMKIDFPEATK